MVAAHIRSVSFGFGYALEDWKSALVLWVSFGFSALPRHSRDLKSGFVLCRSRCFLLFLFSSLRSRGIAAAMTRDDSLSFSLFLSFGFSLLYKLAFFPVC